MTTKNNASLQSWLWETTAGTPLITAVDTQTYHYGGYEEKNKVSPPGFSNEIESIIMHNVRNPTLTAPKRNLEPFKVPYYPTQPIGLRKFLGTATDATPDTITLLQTGAKKAFTHRWQHTGGTNPQLVQACGCFTVGLAISGKMGVPLKFEEENVIMNYEDQNDRSALTTAPIHPDSIGTLYEGSPETKIYTTADALVATLSEAYWVELTLKQEYTVVKDSTGNSQIVHLGKMLPVEGIIHAVFEQNQQWDDWMDKTKRNLYFKWYKQGDTSKYVQIKIANAYFTAAQKSGIVYANYYDEILAFKGELPSVAFNYEGAAFSTFFP